MPSHSDPEHRFPTSLEHLLEDPNFQLLSEELSELCPFQVLRIECSETRHTDILAWLLGSAASHATGKKFLDRFLQQILDTDVPLESLHVDVRTELASTACLASAERDIPSDSAGKADHSLEILVKGRTAEGLHWVIAIEAERDSRKRSAQLLCYDGLFDADSLLLRDDFLEPLSSAPEESLANPCGSAKLYMQSILWKGRYDNCGDISDE
jgi:hypothetical protein